MLGDDAQAMTMAPVYEREDEADEQEDDRVEEEAEAARATAAAAAAPKSMDQVATLNPERRPDGPDGRHPLLYFPRWAY